MGLAQHFEVGHRDLDEAGLAYSSPQGAYYVMVDCTAFGVTDDNAFCRWLREQTR